MKRRAAQGFYVFPLLHRGSCVCPMKRRTARKFLSPARNGEQHIYFYVCPLKCIAQHRDCYVCPMKLKTAQILLSLPTLSLCFPLITQYRNYEAPQILHTLATTLLYCVFSEFQAVDSLPQILQVCISRDHFHTRIKRRETCQRYENVIAKRKMSFNYMTRDLLSSQITPSVNDMSEYNICQWREGWLSQHHVGIVLAAECAFDTQGRQIFPPYLHPPSPGGPNGRSMVLPRNQIGFLDVHALHTND